MKREKRRRWQVKGRENGERRACYREENKEEDKGEGMENGGWGRGKGKGRVKGEGNEELL